MTGFAFGVHENLVKEGINPQTQADEYYSRIDAEMRQRFQTSLVNRLLRKKHRSSNWPRVAPHSGCKETTQSAINLNTSRSRQAPYHENNSATLKEVSNV